MTACLSEFLARLEREHPESVLHVARPIDANAFAVAALAKKLEDAGQNRVLLLNNIPAVSGAPSEFPLALNLFHSRQLCALALGLPAEHWKTELTEAFARLEQQPGTCSVVGAGQAPCQEVVRRGDEVDLRELPVPMYHEEDVGPYLVMANMMRAPGGFYDSTITKNLIQGPRQLSISAHGHHHLRRIIGEYEQADKPAPVVIVLSHHPAFFLGSCALTPYGNEDYGTIAGFMGEGGLRLTPSVTWGEEILVPADADIVIEGEVIPHRREYQNPFGEISGHYQERMKVPVVEVRAMTYRRGAVAQTIFPGHPDHWNLGGVPKEGSVFNAIRRVAPGVKAVHLPWSGCSRFSAYISLKKRDQTDITKAAMAAYMEVQNLKLCVLVDDDVDVFNEREVLWAVATQTRWEQDLQILNHVQAFRGWLGHAGAVIDATKPADPDYPHRNRIPQWALDAMDLRTVLG